jgi:hypothetical protein
MDSGYIREDRGWKSIKSVREWRKYVGWFGFKKTEQRKNVSRHKKQKYFENVSDVAQISNNLCI